MRLSSLRFPSRLHPNKPLVLRPSVQSLTPTPNTTRLALTRPRAHPNPPGDGLAFGRTDGTGDDEGASSFEDDLQALDTLELLDRLEGDSRGASPLQTEPPLDYFGEATFGNFHELPPGLVERISLEGALKVLGLAHARDLMDMEFESLRSSCYQMLQEMGVAPQYPSGRPHRGIFCNRTLNFRSLRAVGYDLDYTLVHYSVDQWEGKAYAVGLEYLRAEGLPVDGLKFDSSLVIRGLVVDKETGNLVKADRFGYVKRAMHGTRMLSVSEIREAYGRSLVDLKNEARWTFLNTLFSVSEAVLYAQLVDRFDSGALSLDAASNSYSGLWRTVSKALFRAHVEGKVKGEIMADPSRFVELDPELPPALLDQKESGKMLLLITNSDYAYTNKIMSFAFDRYLPQGVTWRDLFSAIVVQARKPEFFSNDNPMYEIVTEDGLMRPAYDLRQGAIYSGGSARQLEAALGVSAEDIIYVGDHIYSDVALSKLNLRWRTCLILRELEQEIEALALGREHRRAVKTLINKKEMVGDVFNQLRLWKQRQGVGREGGVPRPVRGLDDELRFAETMSQLLMLMEELDARIGPGIEKDGMHFNERWGFLSRAGLNDKSLLTSQIERYADVLTSRVSNFLRYSPFSYFRSPSQPLVHDRSNSATFSNRKREREGAAATGGGSPSPSGTASNGTSSAATPASTSGSAGGQQASVGSSKEELQSSKGAAAATTVGTGTARNPNGGGGTGPAPGEQQPGGGESQAYLQEKEMGYEH